MNQTPESLRDIDLPATDDLLREDVKRLGALVGEILAEQVSPAFLAEVEALRVASIRRREAGAPIEAVSTRLQGLPLDQAELLVRAFASYFQAVNLAERVHRIRRRRDHERSGDGAQPGGLLAVLGELARDGVGVEEVASLLPRLRIEPVFTAHPTEAVRRALLEKEQLMVASLINGLDGTRTPGELATDTARFRMALTSAWQTADSSPVRPGVEDEREHVGFYLIEVLYRVIPVLYETLEGAITEVSANRGARFVGERDGTAQHVDQLAHIARPFII